MDARYEAHLKPQHMRLRSWLGIATLTLMVSTPCLALNRAVVVRELPLPAIALNLNITFATSELRLPPSDTPDEDIKTLLARAKDEDTPQLHLQLGRLMLWVGRNEEAAVHYRIAVGEYADLVSKEPKNAQAHHEFAEALIALGEDEEAALHVEEALILDASRWRSHEIAADLHAKHAVLAYNQGARVLMEAHLAAAESEANEAMKLAPDNPRPRIMLFLAKWLPAVIRLREQPLSGLSELGKFEELSEQLKQAAAMAPNYPKLKQFAVTCKLTPFFAAQMVKGLEAGLWPDLNEPQRRVLTSCRDELVELSKTGQNLKAEALLFAGVAAFMMADSKAMYEFYQQATDADTTSTVSLEVMVGFLAYERKWPQALKAAEDLVARAPSGKAYTWIGRINAEQRKWKPAEEAFRVALTYDDSQGIANLGLGVVLLKNGGQPAEAMAPLRTAWEQLGDQAEVLLAWGVEIALLGEVSDGAKYVKQALEALPPSPGSDIIAREFGLSIK